MNPDDIVTGSWAAYGADGSAAFDGVPGQWDAVPGEAGVGSAPAVSETYGGLNAAFVWWLVLLGLLILAHVLTLSLQR